MVYMCVRVCVCVWWDVMRVVCWYVYVCMWWDVVQCGVLTLL